MEQGGAKLSSTELLSVCAVILGAGEAEYEGKRMNGGSALAAAGLSPAELSYKEGLGIINGCQIIQRSGRARRTGSGGETSGTIRLILIPGKKAYQEIDTGDFAVTFVARCMPCQVYVVLAVCRQREPRIHAGALLDDVALRLERRS